MRTVTDYTFGVIPMFMLMGALVSVSGVSRELFKAADSMIGHLRGGLGVATVAGLRRLRGDLRLVGRDRGDLLRPWPIRRCGASAIRSRSRPA